MASQLLNRRHDLSAQIGNRASGRAVAVTRFAFRSHYLYDLDSVNFALGMGRFDPRVHQPHPPGYFVHMSGPPVEFRLS